MRDDDEGRVRTILDRWSQSIARRDIDSLLTLFAPDALFVATAPTPLRGAVAIAAYYRAVPNGLTASAEVVDVARDGDGDGDRDRDGVGLVAVAKVCFEVPELGRRRGTLTLALRPTGTGQDRITLYHAALDG